MALGGVPPKWLEHGRDQEVSDALHHVMKATCALTLLIGSAAIGGHHDKMIPISQHRAR